MPCDADLVGAKQDRWNEQHHEQNATANLLSQTLGAGPSRLGQTSDIQSGPSETSRPQIQNNATPTAVVDQHASQQICPNYAPPQSPTCQGNNPPGSLANDSEGNDTVDEIQPLMEQLAFGGMNPNNTHPSLWTGMVSYTIIVRTVTKGMHDIGSGINRIRAFQALLLHQIMMNLL
ncbi:hypothetical protein BS47DRAFT_1360765 [Hydnum rufescens UP504]|uniref:Uncharacterized protein n=1 Tax=Hydnum rufescens UP504 TaxID=1448309 RepID=A0A9P6B1T1_9AGAM|nr:hypothetical protein BS47DRAFT_1360765 [Hydnum rufescens UP504]